MFQAHPGKAVVEGNQPVGGVAEERNSMNIFVISTVLFLTLWNKETNQGLFASKSSNTSNIEQITLLH